MIVTDHDPLFAQLKRILATARGRDSAITLQDLAHRAGASRREVEAVIEQRLLDFPWPLVAGARGVHIPTDAEDINRYVHSLHTRHRRMQIREATVRRKARAAGFPEEAGRFVNPSRATHMELFA